MKENLVSKEQIETLTEFQHKVDSALMAGPEDGEEHIWVETSPAICNYFNNRNWAACKSGYFDFKGIKVCEYGKGEEIRKQLKRQVGEIVHGDARENLGSATKVVATASLK